MSTGRGMRAEQAAVHTQAEGDLNPLAVLTYPEPAEKEELGHYTGQSESGLQGLGPAWYG